MDRIELYRIFLRVVETRSFTRAADTLQMPRSSVSAAVAELEARLGARLLHRTTRVVTPTAEGEVLQARCLTVIGEVEDLESMFRNARQQPQGRLRIDVPGRIGRLIVAPALPEFLDRYPGIAVDLGASDRLSDLVADRVDCALRVGTPTASRLRARRIGELMVINVASPQYLARHGRPQSVDDLDRHLMVGYASPSSGRVEEWEWIADGQTHSRAVPHRVTANSAEAAIACALAGLGLIQVPAYDVAAHLAAGELVEVLPGARAEPMPLTLLFPALVKPPRRVELVARWLEALMRDQIAPRAALAAG